MPRKPSSKHIAVPVLPIPHNDVEATEIFNAIFGTKYTVDQLKAVFAGAAKKLDTQDKSCLDGRPTFDPQPKQAVLKEGHMYISPLLHVATKYLLNELGCRSVGFLAVMMTMDRAGKDQWQFACNGSQMVINTLINAAVFEGRQYLERNSSPY